MADVGIDSFNNYYKHNPLNNILRLSLSLSIYSLAAMATATSVSDKQRLLLFVPLTYHSYQEN